MGNGTEIVNNSMIGNITAENFLDGGSIADYKNMLIGLTDKAIAMIPSAIAQCKDKDNVKIALNEMFRKAVRQSWKSDTQYFAKMQNGSDGLTAISKDMIGEIIEGILQLI